MDIITEISTEELNDKVNEVLRLLRTTRSVIIVNEYQSYANINCNLFDRVKEDRISPKYQFNFSKDFDKIFVQKSNFYFRIWFHTKINENIPLIRPLTNGKEEINFLNNPTFSFYFWESFMHDKGYKTIIFTTLVENGRVCFDSSDLYEVFKNEEGVYYLTGSQTKAAR